MSNAIKTLPGQSGFGCQSAMILNADNQWKQSLMDDKTGSRIVNAAGTLRHDDHRQILDKVTSVRRRNLNGITDLMAAGLTTQASITDMLVGTESINEFQEAKRSMNPTALQNNDTTFMLSYTPLPITHQGWKIPWRQNGFAYKNSIGLSESVRQVAESLEDMLFNGAADILVSVDGVNNSPIYGYSNHPNRVATGISDWSTTPAAIIPEALALVAESFKTNGSSRMNSLTLYVGNDVWTALQADYSADKGDRTFIERLEAITEISKVKPAEKLAAKDVLLVEMDERTIELAVASDIVTIPHQRMSAIDDQVFTTYGAMVPIIRSDRNDRTGIVHGVEAL